MLCKEYTELTLMEQYKLIGITIHLLQNNSESFKTYSSMARNAESNGLLEGITILPQSQGEDKRVNDSLN